MKELTKKELKEINKLLDVVINELAYQSDKCNDRLESKEFLITADNLERIKDILKGDK